jgi:hypothetical protein
MRLTFANAIRTTGGLLTAGSRLPTTLSPPMCAPASQEPHGGRCDRAVGQSPVSRVYYSSAHKEGS